MCSFSIVLLLSLHLIYLFQLPYETSNINSHFPHVHLFDLLFNVNVGSFENTQDQVEKHFTMYQKC